MPVLFEEETATDTTSTTSSEDEDRSSSRKRPRKQRQKDVNQYNIKVKGNGSYAIGPKARIVKNGEDHSLIDVCRRSLENFNAFLKTVEDSRGPEDQIECSVLTEILPFVESNHIRKGGSCNDSLEILAKLGSPTLKRPRIAKHVLKLLSKLVFMDIGRGITNAGLVETHKCLSLSIADGSITGELCHDQRRRAEAFCNVLVAITIGRAREHFSYPLSEIDKKEIDLCITGTEKILHYWSLSRKYRKHLSLEMILSLLKRFLKSTLLQERLKQLLDRCEVMIEGAFVEEDVSFLLKEVICTENGQQDLFIIAKMLHAKMKNKPSTKAYQLFKNITTNHPLFSSSWTTERERYDCHFVLLACQIFLDVTINHNVKATRLDAAEMLVSFRDIKAYTESVVVFTIVEKYITKATFAFDVESRQYLMAKRHEDDLQEKISLDLLRKQMCAVHATGYLEIVEKICQTEHHMLLRGTFHDKPVAVKAKSISYSRLIASHDEKLYAATRFMENETSILRYLSREANAHAHVLLLYADDINSYPYHYIMEYAENGDLRRYVLSRRERNTPSYIEALQLCLASAKSMDFVHQKHVVHNHLRAEHLLVGSNHHCIKVSGFSRARRQSSKIEFEKEFKVEILNSDDPSIRWTAPWGLQNNGALCCSRSDIWAFGVVMYEIITCGGLPYADKNLEEVRNDVLAGLNLSKEQHVRDGYYSIMQRCFGTESISFSQICSELQKLIDQCADEDDRPMVIPENISTVYKPINEVVQQNLTQVFGRPFPANKTPENLSTVCKPVNEVVQQNHTQVFGRPFPASKTYVNISTVCKPVNKVVQQNRTQVFGRPFPANETPENLSTVCKPVNEVVQQNHTQVFGRPFPANKTPENLPTVCKPVNKVVQQNRTQVFGSPFPANKNTKRRFEIRQAALQDVSTHHIKKITALCHPHLVKILKVQKKLNNAIFISYEHFSGPRLGDYIRNKPCTVDNLISLCAQICSAVCYLHSKDIVLCILTMNNAIILNGRHVRLMGLQNMRSPPTSHGGTSSPICTAKVDVQQHLYRWHPPEVIQEGIFSKQSDIWSFGMLMWVMLSSLDELYDKQDLKPFPLYKDSKILGKLKCNSRPFQTSKCPDWMYILMTQCWFYNAKERASSESILECLRCPLDSSILQNWLERNEVCQNWPELNVIQNSGQQ